MNLTEIKQRIEDITISLNDLKAKAEEGVATEEDLASARELFDEREKLKAQRATLEQLAEDDGPQAAHVQVLGPAAEQTPYSLGQYLQDLVKHKRGHEQARVLNYQKKAYREFELQAAATGASEAVPSDGGFLVGTDMTAAISERAYNNNVLAPRADRYELTTNANSIEILGNDETSRADGSRHGGIRHYWTAEAGDLTGSKPKWRKAKLTLHKGGVLFYATDELLADAPLLQRKAEEYVGDEIAFAVQDGMVNGDGAGKPLGILKSPCLVSVAKETGQPADTIVYENTLKMFARFWGSDANALWIANRDIYPQLGVLNVAVGTGGAPVFIPANGAAGQPLSILHGYPLIFIEQCPTLGDAGDLILTDWSQYYLAGKGGVQAAMSVHVEFVADEVVFRWIHRTDGQPAWNSALTPYKGSSNTTRSPFVALAARA